MALIKCHECGGQISDHARTCPHCGAPVIATIKRKKKAFLIELGVRLVFVTVIIVVFVVMFRRFTNRATAPLKAIQQQQQQSH